MLKVGLIGVGKMGLSHHAILGAHPDVEVSAICDNATYITSTIKKHVDVETFKDYRKMIDSAGLAGVFVATPSSTHFEAASYALERGLQARGMDVSSVDPEQPEVVARTFDIANALACEIAFQNDEATWQTNETPAQRWERVRAWVARQVQPAEECNP